MVVIWLIVGLKRLEVRNSSSLRQDRYLHRNVLENGLTLESVLVLTRRPTRYQNQSEGMDGARCWAGLSEVHV